MKRNLKAFVSQKKQALKAANPKSRDRIRHRLHVLLVAERLKSELVHISTSRSSTPRIQARAEIASL